MHSRATTLREHLFEMEELFEHPRISEHFAGREADRMAIDAVLADLHVLGEVGLDVHREHDDVLYTCTMVLRTGEGSVVVTAESALGAALGCLLETLLELHDHSKEGMADLEDFLRRQ
jgi:hypothetical protein